MLVWLDPAWLGGLAAMLCLLFALHQYREVSREPRAVLTLDRRRCKIALERAGQPYFFSKYKVYPTRWFAILKLEDTQQNRTLFLRPDRFTSLRSYQDCRFALRQMETRHVA